MTASAGRAIAAPKALEQTPTSGVRGFDGRLPDRERSQSHDPHDSDGHDDRRYGVFECVSTAKELSQRFAHATRFKSIYDMIFYFIGS